MPIEIKEYDGFKPESKNTKTPKTKKTEDDTKGKDMK